MFSCFVIIASSLAFFANGYENVTISTTLGKITGIKENGFSIFKGIPYTENIPIGSYRFRESFVKNTSYSTNPYNASYFRSTCYEFEDCLYLNIYTPHIFNNDSFKLLPIAVWIHGGGFKYGSGSNYNGNIFMKYKNMLFISINYRLGFVGFGSLESIYNETNKKTNGGLNGINDQIIALKWIKKYIYQYGGDFNKITIFGESAGSASICILLISNVSTNLFNNAIMQSGSCIGPWTPHSEEIGYNQSLSLLNKFNLTDNLDELRLINFTTFLNMDMDRYLYSIDGYILTNEIHSFGFESDKLNSDRLLIGFNSVDSTYPLPKILNDTSSDIPSNKIELLNFLKKYLSSNYIDLLLNKYYLIDRFTAFNYLNQINFTNYSMLWYSIGADLCIICPSIDLAGSILKNNDTNNVYLYHLYGPQYPYYALHYTDVPYIYNNSFEATNFYGIPWNQLLSDFMTDSWIDYIVNGNFSLFSSLWTPFGYNYSAMILSDNNGYIEGNYYQNYRNGVCSFWIEEIGYEKMNDLCWITSSSKQLNDDSSGINVILMVILIGVVIIVFAFLLLTTKLYRNNKLKKQRHYSQMQNNSNELAKNPYGSIDQKL